MPAWVFYFFITLSFGRINTGQAESIKWLRDMCFENHGVLKSQKVKTIMIGQ
jgi:hypothetical protein